MWQRVSADKGGCVETLPMDAWPLPSKPEVSLMTYPHGPPIGASVCLERGEAGIQLLLMFENEKQKDREEG